MTKRTNIQNLATEIFLNRGVCKLMRSGEHEWPEEFKDEDKWLFLTKRQWVIMGIGLLIGGGLVALTVSLGLSFFLPITLTIAFVILILAAVVAGATIPDRFYLFGSGLRIEQVALRLFLKKRKKNKVIYTKNFDNYTRELSGKDGHK